MFRAWETQKEYAESPMRSRNWKDDASWQPNCSGVACARRVRLSLVLGPTVRRTSGLGYPALSIDHPVSWHKL